MPKYCNTIGCEKVAQNNSVFCGKCWWKALMSFKKWPPLYPSIKYHRQRSNTI